MSRAVLKPSPLARTWFEFFGPIERRFTVKLRRLGGLSLFAMMAAFILNTDSMAEDQVFSADISVDYYGKYIWRGQNVNDESVLQPNVSGSAYGFTGSIWANIDLTNGPHQAAPNNTGEFSEIDYTLDYSASVPGAEKLGFSLGVIHYLFPNTTFTSTTEIYAGANLDFPLSPFFTWYGDVNAIEGSYLQFGFGHSFEKLAGSVDYNMGLDLSASFAWGSRGYNNGYFGIDEGAWNDLLIGIGVPITLKYVTLTPSLNISTMLSERIGDASFERTNVWFGFGLSKGF
jgi:hypothetical protein